MDGVVLPAAALLHANAPPLGLGQKAALWQSLCQLFGKDYVALTTKTEGERRNKYTTREKR
jgi:hypothetical protein